MKCAKISTVTIAMFLVFTFSCVKERVISPSEEKPARTLVLLTDFAAGSDVVVRMTGRIRSDFPDVSVQYVPTRPFLFKEAAYILEVAAKNYPDGTFFTGIVEPGATGTRMVFEADGNKKFLLPDNGLATRVIHSMKISTIHKVENPAVLAGKEASKLTFEELYTEATLSLLSKKLLPEFGSVLSNPKVWDIQDPMLSAEGVQGEILFSDNFGNCVTNIPDSLMTGFTQGELVRVITPADSFFMTFGFAYSSVPVAENVAFINASARLELAVNYGNLSERYSIGAGTSVRIRPATVRIGILRFNNSATADGITAGIKVRLAELGFVEGENTILIEKNAMGNTSVLQGLVNELVATGIDIIVPVSTPASQAAVQNVPQTIPIVFTYVTDPSSAGILNQRLNVTGLSDGPNYNQYLQFVKRLFPALSVTGRIYSENEANARYAQSQLVTLAPLFGLNFQIATVTSVADVPGAYQQIRDKGIGAILILDDNAMSLAMPDLVQMALTDAIPVVGQAIDHVGDGALASISVNNDKLAIKTGEIVVAVLRGVDPDNIPVQRFDTDVIAINTQTATTLNYTFPNDVRAGAKYVFP